MAEETKDERLQTSDAPPENLEGQQTAEPEAAEQEEKKLPENRLNVEDIGTLRKKVTVTIPSERIEAKRDEMFGELSQTALVPGFRKGRAPRRLLEKRFGKEVTEDVRNAVIGESIGDAVEKTELKTIGEPDLDLEKIELPASGDLEFSFDVDVAPEFDLPPLKGIQVEKPVMEATDERIEAEISQWAQSQGRHEQTDNPAAEGDLIVAGAMIHIEGQDQPHERPGLNLRVAPGQIEGLPLVDLGKALAGKKAGQTAELKITVPEAHPNEEWRSKAATIKIQISEVRASIVPKINDEFARSAGFQSLDELRQFVRDRITTQLELDIRRRMRQQVEEYLLAKADFDLPEGVVQRHTARLVQRRTVELLHRGVPREKIDESITELQAAATEQARRDLKLQFILGKVAQEQEIEVSPDEVNARVAQIAAMYNRRPERLRQELAADGTLEQLQIVLHEEKSMDKLLEDAEITEAKHKRPAAKTAKKTKKKTAKKATKKAAKKTKKAAKKDKEE